MTETATIQRGEWVRLPRYYGTIGVVDRPWHIAADELILLCGIPITPMFRAELDHKPDEPAEGVKCASCISQRNRLVPRFRVDDYVRVARMVDPITDPKLVGMFGIVTELEAVGGGQYNYNVRLESTGHEHYLNEQMMEQAEPPQGCESCTHKAHRPYTCHCGCFDAQYAALHR